MKALLRIVYMLCALGFFFGGVFAAEKTSSPIPKADRPSINIRQSLKDHPSLIFTRDIIVTVKGERVPMNFLTVVVIDKVIQTDPGDKNVVRAKYAAMGYVLADNDQKAAFMETLAKFRINDETIDDRLRLVSRLLSTEQSIRINYVPVARTGPVQKK